jgi:predicted transcriptional regulator
MQISLDAIDQLRVRANISYREARELLEETGGDLIEALVYIEENSSNMMHSVSEKGKDVLRQARRVAGELHQKKMKVKLKDKTVAEIPVTIGALGTALFPKLAALGVIGLLVSHGSIEVNGEAVSVYEADEDEGGCSN